MSSVGCSAFICHTEETHLKRIVLLLTALLCAICLSGCAPLAINLQRAEDTVPLPLPEVDPIEPIMGDSQSVVQEEIEVWLVSEEYHLIPVPCEITVSDRASRAEEIIRAQLTAHDTADARNPFPDGCTLLNLERSGNVAVVDLTRAGNLVRNNTHDMFNPLMLIAVTYLVMVVILTKALGILERRLAKSDKR